jgi:hypothetical protein
VVQEDSYKIYFVIFNIPTSFYEFWKFEQFLGIKTIRKTVKIAAHRRASNRPTASDARPSGLPCTAGWATDGGPAQPKRRPATRENGARAAPARGAITARSSRTRWRGDALDGDVVGASRRQGAADKHRWGPGVAPGRRSGGGAHPSVRLDVRDRSDGGDAEAEAGGGDERDPMSDGEARWLAAEAREVAAA